MKHILLILIGILFLQCGTGKRPSKLYTIEEFLSTTNYSGGSFSPDGSSVLVTSDESGVYNVYRISLKNRTITAVTHSDSNSMISLGYFPNDHRFLFTADQGGNELNHIYVMNEDGTVKDLTPGEKLKASFAGWAEDDQSFFILSNERDPRYFDVYEYQVSDYARKLIYQNEKGYDLGAISPDKRYLALYHTESRYNSNVFLYDRETKSMKLFTEHEGDIIYYPQTFSPDGKYLYLLTDKDSDFRYLVRMGLSSGQMEDVYKVNWDVSYAYFTKSGNYLIIGVNEDARTKLKVFKFPEMTDFALPEVQNASITSVRFSDDDRHVVFYASSSKMPRDLFYLKIGETQPEKLTNSLSKAIDPEDLVEGKVVRFHSFDGLEIPGILYIPHQASPENKVPALVWVHGGPGGQSRVGYSALNQYLVNHGYAIYAINNRGSSGYGKTFYSLDDRKHGEGDLDDCITSKIMLEKTGVIDPDRIGIIGGSYGGYMVLAALAFRPDEFAVGVDIFGVANWVRTLQSIPPWWESYRKALEKEMGDFDDTEYLKNISPLFHAQNIRKPLMVLQGANDPRVLKVESDEMVEAVRKTVFRLNTSYSRMKVTDSGKKVIA